MKKGIYPALVTPFTESGELDAYALSSLVDRLLGAGVSGFYVCGSTAEVMLLSLEERKRILKIVSAQVAGRADVVAHIGAQRTEDTIELARHAAECGVQAISALPPIYYKYSLDELTQFYLDIAATAELPLIIYNAPALSGVAFNTENTGRLFAEKRILGMKYTSYDLYEMQRMIAANPDKVFINGHDELYLNTLVFGLQHAIGSTFNFMPGNFLRLREKFEAGDMAGAYQEQDRINRVVSGLIKVGVFRGVKGMMQLLGLPGGYCRRPFLPLSAEQMKSLEPLAALCEGGIRA